MYKTKSKQMIRSFYIRKNGECYVQYQPPITKDVGDKIEIITLNMHFKGTISDFTKSGVILKNWKVKNI